LMNSKQPCPPLVHTALGLHGTGHFCLGPGMQDFSASPPNPLFFLRHGHVDRVGDVAISRLRGKDLWEYLMPFPARARARARYSTPRFHSTAPVSLDEELKLWCLGSSQKGVETDAGRGTWIMLQMSMSIQRGEGGGSCKHHKTLFTSNLCLYLR
jgi:hypothetical protein